MNRASLECISFIERRLFQASLSSACRINPASSAVRPASFSVISPDNVVFVDHIGSQIKFF
jgi:hypothetical protein